MAETSKVAAKFLQESPMSGTNQIFLLSLLIIITGFLLKKWKVIQRSDGKALSRIILNFTFPALILSKVRKMPLDTSVFYLPLISFCFCIILMALGYFIFRDKPAKEKGLMMMAMGGFNIGLFAFPIVEAVWGAQGLQYIAMFDVGNALIILGVGYFLADYFSPKRNKEARTDLKYVLGLFLKSMPFMSYLLALLLNYFSIGLPNLVDAFFETISKANMPLVLLLLGIYFNLKIDKPNIRQLSYVLLMRYTFGIAVGLMLYFVLPFGELYRTIILTGLVLPIGLTIIPFSDKFGYNTEFAASLANITIAISFALMWLIVGFTT